MPRSNSFGFSSGHVCIKALPLSCGTQRHFSVFLPEVFSYIRVELASTILLTLVAAICFYQVSHLPFLKTTVYNLSNPSDFRSAAMPGFIQQSPSAPALINFRQHTAALIDPSDDDITKIVKIQHWVRRQEGDEQFYGQPGRDPGPYLDDTEDPQKYLEEQTRGVRSACRRFSYILTGSLLSQGINARLVSLAANFDRSSSLSHNVVEVWFSPLNKWIVVDPTLDAFVLVNGNLASVLEIHNATRAGSRETISLDQHGSRYRLPAMEKYRGYYKHIFVSRTNAVFDGYRYGLFVPKKITFAHYCGPGSEPFPEGTKTILLLALTVSITLALYLTLKAMLKALRLLPKIDLVDDEYTPSEAASHVQVACLLQASDAAPKNASC